nr:unnamed protein product [Callosobruchus chinensis]
MVERTRRRATCEPPPALPAGRYPSPTEALVKRTRPAVRSGAVPASGACGTRCAAPPVAPTAPPRRVAHATGGGRPGGPCVARTASPTPPGATCSRQRAARASYQ